MPETKNKKKIVRKLPDAKPLPIPKPARTPEERKVDKYVYTGRTVIREK